MRNTPENSYGPWLMPARVRRRMQQAQQQTNRSSVYPVGNHNMQRQQHKEQSGKDKQELSCMQWAQSRYKNTTKMGNRSTQRTTRKSSEVMRSESTRAGAQGSRFVVLEEGMEEDGLFERLDTLKKKIQEIPNPSGSVGKAHIRSSMARPKAQKELKLVEKKSKGE